MKKIVLLGDSIRLIGYGPKVPSLLGGEYEVWQPDDNGRYAVYTLHSIMHYWQENLAGADAIQWNNGLWDIQRGTDGMPLAPLGEYLSAMCRIADILLGQTKVLIFATTTPVTAVHPNIPNDDITAYNTALVPLLAEKGVLVNDLNAAVSEDIGRYVRADDHTHLTEEGIDLCAKRTADMIRKAVG